MAKQKKAKKRSSREERYKKIKSISELLMIFLNGVFLNYAMSHFSLKELDFSHCLSVQCDQRDDHSISSSL